MASISFAGGTIDLKVGGIYSCGQCNNLSLVHVSGNAVGVYFTRVGTSSTYSVHVVAYKEGIGCVSYESGQYHIFKVSGVSDIKIPESIELVVGDQFTYTPIISDEGTSTAPTWASSNTNVATVDANGIVTTVGIGKANITCTASNGVSAQSLVTVSPKLAESLTLDIHSQEMTAGGSVQLLPTILPANASSTTVKWMTTNENVAQVDDQGMVTAIGPGYCSIFCIADDGSRKYDKCLVHVLGTAASRADVNGDGQVSVTDAFSVIDVILNNP